METRILGDAFYSFSDFSAVGGVVRALFFDVEIFCVFADDDEVDGGGGCGDGFYGSDVGVEGEALAEGDDGGGVAFCCYGWGSVIPPISICA